MSKLLEQINTAPKKTSKLVNFAMINPSVRLERGKEYPFLDMSEVKALTRIPELSNKKIFIGSGSKFEKGDILFARITPCLENGKITRVLSLNTPAFGSTEFIVLRGKDGISDNDFIYYLSQTYKLRKKAEQSMIGASGRQRVDRVAFENIPVTFPDLPTQKKIAEILSAYDAKIENNNKIIKNLEATAQAIFNEWFVNFRLPAEVLTKAGFPRYEKVKMIKSEMGEIPVGWEVFKLKDIFTFIKGKKPSEVSEIQKENFLQQILIDSFENGKKLYADKDGMVIVSEDDLLMVMDGASSGRVEFGITGIVGSTMSKLQLHKPVRSILYFYLKSKEQDIKNNTSGSAIPHTDKEKVYGYEIALPKNTDYFEKILFSFIKGVEKLNHENVYLKQSRDQLLAKLI